MSGEVFFARTYGLFFDKKRDSQLMNWQSKDSVIYALVLSGNWNKN